MAKFKASSTASTSIMPGPSERSAAQAASNRFALLDPAESLEPRAKPTPEPVTSFLTLSPELRQQIYNLIISDHSDSHGTRLAVKKHREDHRRLNPRKFKVRGTYAMLYVSREVGYEFFVSLERSVPFHVSLSLEMGLEEDKPLLECLHLNTSLPVFAKRLALDIQYTIVYNDHDFDSDHQIYVISSPTFEALNRLLGACPKLAILTITWQMNSTSYTRGQQLPHDLIFDSTVQVIESLPKILRYAMSIGDSGMFASRAAPNMDWQDTRVVRFTREILPEPDGEWADLLRELNADTVMPRLPEN
ncbi:hypothetical protein LTR36_003255 [Oleoguttula mirabilis]|uniref:Uncharacterized protein n=1 Tax=Oleoguttula mirabilis TaxID=1507867 RepID=A0AAV9JXC6_9PEZI|nr:hypothetical protein LTR36_003255 [Oleoguttula mirabilis]